MNERAVLSQRQRRYQGFARDQIAPERTLSEAPMAYGAISPNDAPALRRTVCSLLPVSSCCAQHENLVGPDMGLEDTAPCLQDLLKVPLK